MRHGKDHKKLGRTASHRRAMLSNLVASLFEHKQVRTTLAKAKEGRRYAERCITFGKKGTVGARRHVYKFIPRRNIVQMLFDEIAPAFEDRAGGYTRIIKLGRRSGDNAEIVILELVGYEGTQLEKQHKAAEKRAERMKRREEQEEAEAQTAPAQSGEAAEK